MQKCRCLLSKAGFPKQCLHIFYLRKVSNIFTQRLLYSEIFGFWVCTVDFKVRSRTCHFGTDKLCEEHFTARGVTCRWENSPEGDAHGMSNSESESSVAIAQGLARTLKDHVEFKIEKMTNPKSPLLPWLVEYVGILYTLFSFEKSKDGMTPFRKLKGRDWVISLPSFGECVDYRVRTQHTVGSKIRHSVFICVYQIAYN